MIKRTNAALEKRHREAWERYGLGPDRFSIITFASARFDGGANFSSRTFDPIADFTRARFYSPPIFDDAASANRIDFTGAHVGFAPRGSLIHWTKKSRIPFLLRAFRKIAEETKNHDLERDLYIEERKAERGVYLHQRWEELKKVRWIEKPLIAWGLIARLFWILVMLVYWALSNYGRSLMWPAIWLGLSVPFFYWRYTGVLAPLPIPPEGFQFWLVLQNIVSITLVFFIGLALRNYFKIK
jgi:hypothetical protein